MKSYDVCECGAPLRLMERPTPKPTGTEVLLKVVAAGVCHSDLHIWEGFYDIGGGKRLKLADRGVKLPLTMGHENVGEVVAVGPDATGVKIGDRRLVHPWLGCGKCAVCRRGDEQLCRTPFSIGVFRAGGYADHLLVPHPRYLFDIGNIPPERAAPLACSGITTYGALKKVGPLLQEEPVVIIGAGRSRAYVSRAAPGDGRQGRNCCRHRSGQARGGAEGRCAGCDRSAVRRMPPSRSSRQPRAAPGR